tara:strand:+ start:15054 stop:15554 length:501 start_codon:yes stop_codon:yes gene_type:complete
MEILHYQSNDNSTLKRASRIANSAFAVALLALLGLSSGAAAQPSTFEELQHDTHELMDSIANYTAQQRDNVVAEVEQSLEALDEHTQRMQERIDANMQVMSVESQELARDAMEELHEQRAVVGVHLEQLANNTTDTWDEVKAGFTEAYEKMFEAWEEAEKSLTASS